MAIESIPVFETTIQKTDAWLKTFQQQIGTDINKDQAYHLMRAGLHTIRDRMTVDEAAHFSAQLPLLLRGTFYEGYKPSQQPRTMRTEQDFCNCLDEKINKDVPVDKKYVLPALFKTLKEQISEGQIKDVESHMPEDMQAALVHA
ncbi:MAG: DUF2267 domain-containing protein [Fimbriimonadaceae bacterium]